MKRRSVIKGLTFLPIAGSLFPFKSVLASPGEGLLSDGLKIPATAGEFLPDPNIFRSIGVEPIINCRGTFTIIGGSVERPEVRAAMEAASKDFVQYDELAMELENVWLSLQEQNGEWFLQVVQPE